MQRDAKKVIRFPALQQMLDGVSRSSIFRWERDGKFPKHFSLGTNSVCWWRSDIEQWLLERASKREKN